MLVPPFEHPMHGVLGNSTALAHGDIARSVALQGRTTSVTPREGSKPQRRRRRR